MSLLLGIAGGAVKIGQKIFGGIKKRRENKIAKKAQNLLEQQTKFNTLSSKFGFTPGIVGDNEAFAQIQSFINPGAGTQSISSAANALLNSKGSFEAIQPTAANVALEERTQANGLGNVNPMLLIGGAFILILLFISKRR